MNVGRLDVKCAMCARQAELPDSTNLKMMTVVRNPNNVSISSPMDMSKLPVHCHGFHSDEEMGETTANINTLKCALVPSAMVTRQAKENTSKRGTAL